MKKLSVILSALTWAAAGALASEAGPRGRVLELHSCEVYVGGCKASSEYTMGGRYMLQAWKIEAGHYAGADLGGLPVVLLSISDQNLAENRSEPMQAVLYLPAGANARQREALSSWVLQNQTWLRRASLRERAVPINFVADRETMVVRAGEEISVEVGAREPCSMTSCGEQLWYTPRAETTGFAPLLNRRSQVDEPWLQLKWSDRARLTAFGGRFGEPPETRVCQPSASHYSALMTMH